MTKQRGSDGSKAGKIGTDIAVGRLQGAERKAVVRDAVPTITRVIKSGQN